MKNLLLISLLFISAVSFGQIKNNNQRIFNVENYGAKHDSTTDDTQAIQAAVNACVAAGGGTVFFPNGIYIIAGSIQTSIGGKDMNAQIYIPLSVNLYNPVTVNFVGEASASPGNVIPTPFGTSVYKNMGVTLYSTYTGTRSTTNKGTAIIGTGEASAGAFNFNTFTLKNINFEAKNNPNGAGPEIGAANGRNALGFNVENCTYIPDIAGPSFTLPTREISGFETPETGGGASYVFNNVSVAGLKWGFIFGEHVSGNQVTATMCYYGFGMKPGGHSSTFQRLNAYWCTYGINWYQFGANPTTYCAFNIYEMDVEFGVGNTGKFYNTVYTVVDSTNKFLANINYAVINQSLGLNNASWSMNGGTGVLASAIGVTTAFGFDGTSVYTVATGQTSITKSSAADHGYDFTNSNTGGYAHTQLIGSTYRTELWQSGSAVASYSVSLANMGTLYTNSATGFATVVDANAPWVLATGTAPATERLRVSGTGVVTPGANVSQDFGSTALAWKDVYLSHPVGKSAIGVSSGLGTNVTSVTPAGSDTYFSLSVVTSATATGTIGAIAFGRTWGATPYCVISSANAATGAMIASAGGYVGLNATSTSSMTLVGLFTGAGTWIFNCHCGQ